MQTKTESAMNLKSKDAPTKLLAITTLRLRMMLSVHMPQQVTNATVNAALTQTVTASVTNLKSLGA